MMTSPMDRIQILENIEKEISSVLQSAGSALTELSKDKPANKLVESHVQQFVKHLTSVETDLSKQINYLSQVSTGQAHEGSSYSAQKTLQMTMHRLDHIRSEVNKLEKIKLNPRIRQVQQAHPQQQQTPQQQQNSQQQQTPQSQQQSQTQQIPQQQQQAVQSQQVTTSSQHQFSQFQMQQQQQSQQPPPT